MVILHNKKVFQKEKKHILTEICQKTLIDKKLYGNILSCYIMYSIRKGSYNDLQFRSRKYVRC